MPRATATAVATATASAGSGSPVALSLLALIFVGAAIKIGAIGVAIFLASLIAPVVIVSTIVAVAVLKRSGAARSPEPQPIVNPEQEYAPRPTCITCGALASARLTRPGISVDVCPTHLSQVRLSLSRTHSLREVNRDV